MPPCCAHRDPAAGGNTSETPWAETTQRHDHRGVYTPSQRTDVSAHRYADPRTLSQTSTQTHLVFLELLSLPLLQSRSALLSFEPLLFQPPPALLELLLPQCLGLLLLLQPHCLLGRCGKGAPRSEGVCTGQVFLLPARWAMPRLPGLRTGGFFPQLASGSLGTEGRTRSLVPDPCLTAGPVGQILVDGD